MIVGVSPKQWAAILSASGLTREAAELGETMGLDFAEEGDRYAGREALCKLLEPWFQSQLAEELMAKLDDAGVCWGKYQTLVEMVNSDPDCSVQNPLFDLVEQPGVGSWLMPGNPLGFEALPRENVRAAPQLGEHTDEILADTLGIASGEIGRLHDAGVIAGVLR